MTSSNDAIVFKLLGGDILLKPNESGNTTSSSASGHRSEVEERDFKPETDKNERIEEFKTAKSAIKNESPEKTSKMVQLDLLDAMDDDDFLVESRKPGVQLDDSFEVRVKNCKNQL